MTARWLTGAILFVLGFGSAFLLRLPAADAAADTAAVKEEVIEGTTLKFVNGSEDFRLKYPAGGKTDYLIAVVRKAGTAAQTQISSKVGEAVFSKKDLESLTVFQVKPLISLQPQPRPAQAASQGRAAAVIGPRLGLFRCWHPQVYCPLPPPPDPPIRVSFTSLKAPTSGPR